MSASTPQEQILGIPPSCSMSCVRTLLTVSLLTLGSSQLAFAQEVSATLGVTRTMKSTILGEDRKVFVRLPTGYDTSGNAYPVLYLLDGTPAFLLEMIAITTRLRNDRNAPEMIIVAIENTNRNRDMMPVVAKDYPGPAACGSIPWFSGEGTDPRHREDLSHFAAENSAR